MKTSNKNGYTIVEVMIFMAVTGLLIVSAMALITGQQNKTEFTQGTRDLELQIQDIINNVATGYYQNTNNFVCRDSGNGDFAGFPTITNNTSNNQGANIGCTFIGHVLQFAPDGMDDTMKDYVVVGRQFYTPSSSTVKQIVDSLEAAKPTPIAPSVRDTGTPPNPPPDASAITTLPFGLTVQRVTYDNNGTLAQAGAIGFFSTFVPYGNGLQQSGSQSTDIVIIPGVTIANPSNTTKTTIDGIISLENGVVANTRNPKGGVNICLKSGGTNQYAVITLGVSGRDITNLKIYSIGDDTGGVCP
jgi:type II secretory pathway pseudopilin PulG